MADKITRMVGRLALIEDGEVWLPREAPWLDILLSEFRAFPSTHEEQVDALSQFLNWTKEYELRALATRDPETGRKLRPSRQQMAELRKLRERRRCADDRDDDEGWDDH